MSGHYRMVLPPKLMSGRSCSRRKIGEIYIGKGATPAKIGMTEKGSEDSGNGLFPCSSIIALVYRSTNPALRGLHFLQLMSFALTTFGPLNGVNKHTTNQQTRKTDQQHRADPCRLSTIIASRPTMPARLCVETLIALQDLSCVSCGRWDLNFPEPGTSASGDHGPHEKPETTKQRRTKQQTIYSKHPTFTPHKRKKNRPT